jgi:hypothetical protein
MRRRLAMLTAPLVVAALLAGCGSDKPAATGTTPAPSKATTFVLDEWSVVPPSEPIPAGEARITATNNGDEPHEVVFVRATDTDALPTKSDGSVDEDKIPESMKVGEIADLAAGKSATKTFDLPAGDYVAFCNLVENMDGHDDMGSDMDMEGMGNGEAHVHYERGMVNYFTVT